jgi:hypothetical protein
MIGLVLSHGWGYLRVRDPGVVILESGTDHLASLADLLSPAVARANCEVEAREWQPSHAFHR